MLKICIISLIISVAVEATNVEVVELTDDNFDQKVKELPHILVNFFVPWS